MRATALAILASIGVAAGCADLPPISVGVCGNGVVEPTTGEDCDGTGKDGVTCAEPGTTHECRYMCQDKDEKCPTGFSCGLDGLCRAQSSTWSSSASALGHSVGAPLDVVIADADGDGLGDVFEAGQSSVVIHYDATNSTDAKLSVARDPLLPVTGPVIDLSGDGKADAVLPADLGFFVSLGNPSRVERTTAYGAVSVPAGVSDVRMFTADLLPEAAGIEIGLLAVLNATPIVIYVSVQGKFKFIGTLPDVPSNLAGPVRSGRLNESSAVPCEELVLGFKGRSSIDLFVPCIVDGGDAMLNDDETTPTTPVRLPSGATVAGPVEVRDLDRDGHLDLMVPAQRGNRYEIDVAYGRGDGTFDSRSGASSVSRADDAAGTAVTVLKDMGHMGVPLAVSDLDGDESPDWVDAIGIYLSRGTDLPVLAGSNPGAPWTSALIGRLDGDNLLDVAVASNAGPGVTVYANAGHATLTAFTVETEGITTLLGYGDFDGDRIGDLAVVTRHLSASVSANGGDAGSDTLSVLYGSPFGVPSAPKEIGEVDHVEQLAAAPVDSGKDGVVDGADELGALTRANDGTLGFAIIFGQGNRDLRSPYDYTITDLGKGLVYGYAPVRIVPADVDGDGHLDVLTLGQDVDKPAENRLWTTPMVDEASIVTAKSTHSELLDMSFDWLDVQMGALDLDGHAGDEVVVLGPRSGGAGYQSAVASASFGPDGATYSLAQPAPLDVAFRRTELPLSNPSDRNGRLRTGDVDGDGATDVIALGEEGGRSEVFVFFNDRTGALGTPVPVTNAEDLDVRDFALSQGKGDRRPRIVMLSTTGVYIVEQHGRILSAGNAPVFSMAANAANAPSLVAAGDVNGDGVVDLALSSPVGFEIRLGLSANPKDH